MCYTNSRTTYTIYRFYNPFLTTNASFSPLSAFYVNLKAILETIYLPFGSYLCRDKRYFTKSFEQLWKDVHNHELLICKLSLPSI